MELGGIVVTGSPDERNLYTEQKPRSQDLLGKNGKQIHRVFKYLTGEMKEYGEWMKSKHGDVFGALKERAGAATSPLALIGLGHKARGCFTFWGSMAQSHCQLLSF